MNKTFIVLKRDKQFIQDKYPEFAKQIWKGILKGHHGLWLWCQFDGKWLITTDWGKGNLSTSELLWNKLRGIDGDIDDAVRPKPQFLIDDDDDYQDALELKWHLDELRDRRKEIIKEFEDTLGYNPDNLCTTDKIESDFVKAHKQHYNNK